MPGSEKLPDLDPTVNQYLDDVAEGFARQSVPSKTFGDELIVEPAERLRLLPGETPQEAHIRLQTEHKGGIQP